MRTSPFLVPAFAAFMAAAAFAQTPCENLKSLSIPGVEFTSVEVVAAGPYQPPARAGLGAGGPASLRQPQMLPAHCRVAATLRPSSDSDIKMELWMPAADWNGRFEMVGNGGWAEIISFPQMAAALREGFATASTDTGHEGGNGMFALGHPEKIVDFGWRAVHDTVLQSKALIKAYYGEAQKYAYWNGCSTGGRQALVEVTKFPDDFDGVLAGAPANPHIHLHAAGVERSIELMRNPGGALSEANVEALHKAILAKCDALDGLKDGLIGDPAKCHFDPAVMLCKGEESDGCLTPAQVKQVKIVFSDIKDKKGDIIWTGYEPGHQDADYDFHKFDLDRDVALADQSGIDALTDDLSAFKAHGGKLLLYHGWADPGIPPGNTVNFYSAVLDTMGPNQSEWLRLFMIPGMQHCAGGPGTDQFNKMAVIERWREDGKAPDEIVAAHVTNGQVDLTRPLCPYPRVAVYAGSGLTNDAGNFTCQVPR